MKTFTLALSLSAALVPTAAGAQQFQAGADIFTGTGTSHRYVGRGGTVQPSNRALGSVADGGFDTFDNFGYFNGTLGGLTLNRQVELLSGNTYRFFDSFTNTGNATVTTTVSFFGNLGSDGDELVGYDAGGLMVSCEGDGAGACIDDAVLALVSGNTGSGRQAITPNFYNAAFDLTVGAGQTVSLLNYAFLARDIDGPLASDVALATRRGLSLVARPDVAGLTKAQLATVANFSAASMVPEPASWALMIVGIGGIGAGLRRRTTRVRVAA